MDHNDTLRSLLPKGPTTAKPTWLGDIADVFVLSCSFLLITASITLVILVFHTQATFAGGSPPHALLILQRIISALSVTNVSATIMVAEKRYVLFKLTKGGIRSQRVAVYASPSIGNLTQYLISHGFEIPLLALLAAWVLGLVTGLTVNNVWMLVPAVQQASVRVPSGRFNASVSPTSQVDPVLGQLSYVMGSICTNNSAGIIKIRDLTLASGHPMGILYYPPIPSTHPNSGFSFPTSLNAFNISMEPLPSAIPRAIELICADASGDAGYKTGQIWYEYGKNQEVSIIANSSWQSQPYRLTASAVVLDGKLRSTGHATEFIPNGRARSIRMSEHKWGRSLAILVCNATYPSGTCSLPSGTSLLSFSMCVNDLGQTSVSNDTSAVGTFWSTAMGMAMGAYSSVYSIGTTQTTTVTVYDKPVFTVSYPMYILIANIVVSAIMLVVVVRLRMASRLGADFMNATRLLLDPLKNPELFNTALGDTVVALRDPYMLVNENNEFLLREQSASESAKET